MTIEEFRARMNSGPSAEELKILFEKRIADIANNTVDKRDDLKEIKSRLDEIETELKKIQSILNPSVNENRQTSK